MGYYDSTAWRVLANVAPPTQIGGNLHRHSSNGWFGFGSPITDPASRWDANQIAAADPFGYTRNPVDVCVHQGEVHACWIEFQWNGSKRVMRGPYVAKWNGASWDPLGGEVESALTAAPVGERPAYAVGTKFAPAHPRIASDGTSLYVAYTVHEVAVAPNRPPNGSGTLRGLYNFPWPAWDYQLQSGDVLTWDARAVHVRRWTGAAWDLYGHVPAKSYNSLASQPLPLSLGTSDTYVNHPDTRGDYLLDLCAGPNEPGVAYVAWVESGYPGPASSYSDPPFFFVGFDFGTFKSGAYRLALAARFDGGAGVVKEVTAQRLEYGVYSGSGAAPLPDWYSWTDLAHEVRLRNDTGTPVIFTARSTSDGVVSGISGYHLTDVNLTVQRWSDLAVLHTEAAAEPNPAPAPAIDTAWSEHPRLHLLGYSSPRALYYFGAGSTADDLRWLREIPDDFSAASQPLDYDDVGEDVWQIRPETFAGTLPYAAARADFELVVEEPDNIWIVLRAFNRPGITGSARPAYALYHRPCRGWTHYDEVNVQTGNTHVQAVNFRVAILRDGDDLYAAGMFRPTATNLDYAVQVWRTDICRGCRFCAEEVEGVWLHTDPEALPFRNPYLTGP